MSATASTYVKPAEIMEMSAWRSTGRFLTAGEIKRQSRRAWLVQDLLPANGLALMVGAKESLKTFLALDLALTVASGDPWHGRMVQGGPVVFVSGEGQAGLGARIKAWEVARGKAAPDAIHFLLEPLNLRDEDSVTGFLDEVAQVPQGRDGQPPTMPALVIIDTLARCFGGGDENTAQDMGQFVEQVDRIRQRTGAGVLVIHHPGRGKSIQPRGSYALEAAVDTILTVERNRKTGDIRLGCSKQKDAEHFAASTMTSRKIDLGGGLTSLVLDSEDEGLVALDKVILNRLREKGSLSMSALRDAMAGGNYPNGPSEKTLRPRLKTLEQLGFVLLQREGQGGKHVYQWSGKRWEESI